MNVKVKSLMIIVLCGLSLRAGQTVTFTLEQCISTALENSETIAMEKEKQVEAVAGLKEARTGFLPKFSANASFTKLDEAPYIDASAMGDMFGGLSEPFLYLAFKDPTSPDTGLISALGRMAGSGVESEDGKIYVGDDKLYNVIISVQQPIFTGFKVLNGYRAAQNNLKAAQENRKRVERDLVLSVKQAFYRVLQAQRYIEVSDTSIHQLEVIVQDLENMMAQGMVGELDVMKTRVQLYNVKLMKVRAINGVTMAKAALCNTIGMPIETELELSYEQVRPESVNLPKVTELIGRAQKSQPEIRAMEYRREALMNVVKINKANYMPNVVAQGNYNLKRPNRSYEPEFYNSWDVTLALQMNLFDWGEGWHKKTRSESQLRQLEIGITQMKNGIALGIEKSYLDVGEAFEKIDLAEKALEQARKSYSITIDHHKYGMVKNSDLLDAQRTLTEAKIEYCNGIINYYLKRSELEHLLGEKN